jgi:hypothetical protein
MSCVSPLPTQPVTLVREVPEAMKRKKIVVGGGAPLSIVEGEKAEKAA